MATYATRLTTAFGAGVDRVRRWSQGSAQDDQQHPNHPQRRFATTPGDLDEVDDDAISDSPPPRSPVPAHPPLASVPEGTYVRPRGDEASEQTLATITTSTSTSSGAHLIAVPDAIAAPPVMSPPEGGPSNTLPSPVPASTGGSLLPARASGLPEDDGQRQLRQKLSDITQSGLPERDRARKMHQIMTEKWHQSRAAQVVGLQQVGGGGGGGEVAPASPTATRLEMLGDPDPSDKKNPYKLLQGDARKTYYSGPNPPAPEEEDGVPPRVLGCSHYRRGVRLQCSTCERWHTCRFCHDENEDHALVRRETKNMLCMHCGRPQPAQQDCRFCGVRSAKYYCDKVGLGRCSGASWGVELTGAGGCSVQIVG